MFDVSGRYIRGAWKWSAEEIIYFDIIDFVIKNRNRKADYVVHLLLITNLLPVDLATLEKQVAS